MLLCKLRRVPQHLTNGFREQQVPVTDVAVGFRVRQQRAFRRCGCHVSGEFDDGDGVYRQPVR